MKKSFRDPSGYVEISGGRVRRAIARSSVGVYQKLFQEKWYQTFVSENKIQKSTWIQDDDLFSDFVWLEHEPFDFPLFPHQVSAEQLFRSAQLTLEIAQIAFENGWVLKDASAWNVVSLYGQLQFCDITSFEPYDESSLWIAYGQFCRHYIIPLLLFKHLDLYPSGLLLLNRDGIEPLKAKKMLGLRSYTSLAALETVLLPSKLTTKHSRTSKHPNTLTNENELKKTIFLSTLKRLGKYIERLKPSNYIRASTWSNYEAQRKHYSSYDLDIKLDFVKRALERTSGRILDLGCNQGQYSLLASELGLKVVASDFDEHSLIKLQAKLGSESINVMQLNFAHPTPAIGWKNGEHESFLTQANNYFELVLCLGLIHHLLVSERIPLPEILDLLASISKRYVLIEWVNPDDEMFSEIASLNAHLYTGMNHAYFEAEATINFNILDSLSLSHAKRKLYLLEKKSFK